MFSIFSQFIFGNSSHLGGVKRSDSNEFGRADQAHQQHSSLAKSSSWKDKSLCFDLRSHELDLNRGEQLIGCFYPIEDVKGNQDELGLMKVTNMRLIWICCRKKRVSLSIGWRTVSLIYEQNLKDTLGGTRTSLFVLAKHESTKYEFVFNKLLMPLNYDDQITSREYSNYRAQSSFSSDQNALEQLRKFCKDKSISSQITHLSPDYLDDPFEVVLKTWHAYKQTHLFRHCRSNLPHIIQPDKDGDDVSSKDSIKISDLIKLPSEEIIEIFSGVIHSESKSSKYLGTLILSNIRIIWIDESFPVRNLSIPYIRVDSIKLKQGEKIIVNTHDYLGSSRQADFRLQKLGMISGKQSTRIIYEQMLNFCALYKTKPRFGPESYDESIDFMSHLRPIELFLGQANVSGAIENFRPEVTRRSNNQLSRNDDSVVLNHGTNEAEQKSDQDEEAEDELNQYRSKYANYVEDQPIEMDAELTYSMELGLAIERPKNGDQNLLSIWRIEI